MLVNLAGIARRGDVFFHANRRFRQKTYLPPYGSSDILTNDPARDRRFRADRSGFLLGKGFEVMAVKKRSGESKIQEVSAPKRAGGKKSAAKKEMAPKKSAPAASKQAAPKKAAPKKAAAAPIKL